MRACRVEFEVNRSRPRPAPEQAAESALDLERASLPPVLVAQERDDDGLGLGSEHARLRLDMRPEFAAAIVRGGNEDPGIAPDPLHLPGARDSADEQALTVVADDPDRHRGGGPVAPERREADVALLCEVCEHHGLPCIHRIQGSIRCTLFLWERWIATPSSPPASPWLMRAAPTQSPRPP